MFERSRVGGTRHKVKERVSRDGDLLPFIVWPVLVEAEGRHVFIFPDVQASHVVEVQRQRRELVVPGVKLVNRCVPPGRLVPGEVHHARDCHGSGFYLVEGVGHRPTELRDCHFH